MPNQKKIDQVKDLTERLKESKSLVLVDYRGLTHQQLNDLRKKLKETGSFLMVTKNTLLELALKNSQFSIFPPKADQPLAGNSQFSLAGPTAAFFISDDPLPSLQVLAKFIAEFDLPQIKIGFLEGELATKEKILRLASLPSKEVLIAQVVAYLKAPTQRLTYALAWNLQKLALVLRKMGEKN